MAERARRTARGIADSAPAEGGILAALELAGERGLTVAALVEAGAARSHVGAFRELLALVAAGEVVRMAGTLAAGARAAGDRFKASPRADGPSSEQAPFAAAVLVEAGTVAGAAESRAGGDDGGTPAPAAVRGPAVRTSGRVAVPVVRAEVAS